MDAIYFINEANKFHLNKPCESNVIYYSELKQWHSNDSFRSFSIKAVHSGSILYKTADRHYKVNAGQCLLAPRQQGVEVFFDSKSVVKSMCIDIQSSTVTQAIHSLQEDSQYNLESHVDGDQSNLHFFEHVYSLPQLQFGKYIGDLFTACSNRAGEIEDDWHLQLAEALVRNQLQMRKYLHRLPAEKMTTRKELLRRVLVGKEFIDENFLRNPGIPEVANYCNISQFHFYRSFRQAFQVTPHDYLTNLRLDHAKKLLASGNHSATAVSKLCSFRDLPSFSRSFKKKFGLAPSEFASAQSLY